MNKISNRITKITFQILITLMRVLFGMGWFMAGITKITEKNGFSEPEVFLNNYLLMSLEKQNVPDFYKYFTEHTACFLITLFPSLKL
ncbi:hypothetical protein [Bacillus sp. 165]|uniref:hypothetical protein n=1 Tax=Bacillus sp. 165 TaxID=1529117 RepID=UPI001ADA2E06|nr:hypothetical protein [Bacillus sp. 165]MBO9128314.1 hypothetical protein [Bacillus sp. 165]